MSFLIGRVTSMSVRPSVAYGHHALRPRSHKDESCTSTSWL